MLDQTDLEFCEKQRNGLTTITGDDITSVFNRFKTLYPMYNRLYNKLPAALTALGANLPKRLYDNVKATKFIVQYLGGANILGNLSAQRLDDDIYTLTWILDYGAFHIKLNDGQPDPIKDAELARDIISADPDTKAKAILCVVYYVRCNMEHGEKHQDEHQRLLVSAVTRITQAITDQLYDKLAAAPTAQA